VDVFSVLSCERFVSDLKLILQKPFVDAAEMAYF